MFKKSLVTINNVKAAIPSCMVNCRLQRKIRKLSALFLLPGSGALRRVLLICGTLLCSNAFASIHLGVRSEKATCVCTLKSAGSLRACETSATLSNTFATVNDLVTLQLQ